MIFAFGTAPTSFNLSPNTETPTTVTLATIKTDNAEK